MPARQSGQNLVEFALIAPVFLLLVLAAVQAGLMINAQATLDNATREAARAAAICGTQLGSFTYRGTRYSANQGLNTCVAAAQGEFRLNRGILPQGANQPSMAVCSWTTPTPPTGKCSSGASNQAGTIGGGVEVDVSFNYDFYLDPLLGNAAPTIAMSSSARVIAQQ